MIFSPHFHIVFDLLGFGVGTFFFRRELNSKLKPNSAMKTNQYWYFLVVGALVGAYFAGSFNLSVQGVLKFGHSIAGALAGGIFAVEIYKKIYSINGSTGFIFVPSLTAGIAIGRLGCFFSGLADETFGTPTTLPIGINFGDQILRQPVQLYESCAMVIAFFSFRWFRKSKHYSYFSFYLFILFYAAQRFIWEFLKPYPTVFYSLNTFHIICLVLVLYATIMLVNARAHALSQK